MQDRNIIESFALMIFDHLNLVFGVLVCGFLQFWCGLTNQQEGRERTS